jgi:hypothetical protein
MKLGRRYSRTMLPLGYIFFFGGIVGLVADVVERSQFLVPSNLGITFANLAFMAIGLVAMVVSKSLQKIEDRLDRLERGPSHIDG